MTWVYNGSPELDAISTYKTGVVVCIVVPILMTVVVGLRVHTRLHIVCSVGADDFLTVTAALFATAYAALWITQSRLGLGLPVVDRPPENLPQYGRHNYAGRPLYVVSTLCFKFALCISYLRLTRGAQGEGTRRAIWILIAFTGLYNVTYIFTLLFACSPVAKSWNYALEGKCLPMDPFYYSTGVLTMLNDFALFVLPVPLVWRLKMSVRTKFGLSVMFLLALVTTFCSVMRIVSINDIHRNGDTANFILWGVIEACVGTMTSSIPALRPLFRKSSLAVKRKVRLHLHGEGHDVPVPHLTKSHTHNVVVSSLSSDAIVGSQQDSAVAESQLSESSDGSEDEILPNDQVDSGVGSFVERLTIAITRTTEIHISYKTASRGTPPEAITPTSERPTEEPKPARTDQSR